MQKYPVQCIAAIVILRLISYAVLVAANPGFVRAIDTNSYIQPASALLTDGAFVEGPGQRDSPVTIRTPGYPFFIAVAYKLFGTYDISILVLQAAADLIAVILTFLIGRLLCGTRAGLIAALICAINPNTLHHHSILISEAAFQPMLMVTLLVAERVIRGGGKRLLYAVLLGALAAGTAYIRPISYYWISPLLLWVLIDQCQRGQMRRAILVVMSTAMAWGVVVGMWQMRNKAAIGDATFSQIQNVNLYLYRAADVHARSRGLTLADAQQELNEKMLTETKGEGQAARFEYMRTEAKRIIAADPKNFLISEVRGLAKLMLGPVSTDMYIRLGYEFRGVGGPLSAPFQMSPGDFARQWLMPHWTFYLLLACELALLGLLYVGFAGGAFILWRRGLLLRGLPLLIVLSVIYFIAVSAGPEAYARLRAPIEPLLALFAACFVESRMKRQLEPGSI